MKAHARSKAYTSYMHTTHTHAHTQTDMYTHAHTAPTHTWEKKERDASRPQTFFVFGNIDFLLMALFPPHDPITHR